MKTRNKIFLIAITTFLVFPTIIPDSYACSCAPIDYDAAYEDSKVVYVGKVIDLTIEEGRQTVTFDVTSVGKGTVNQTHILNNEYTDEGMCGINYEIESTYYVFEHYVKSDSLGFLSNEPSIADTLTSICSTKKLFDSFTIAGGSIGIDPELAPTYSKDWTFQSNSVLFAGPLMALGVSMVLIIPYFVLKKKNIPPRRYMLVIAASILIFFSTSLFGNIESLLTFDYDYSEESQIFVIGQLISMTWGIIPLVIGIILLKKAKLRIRK